MKFYNTTGKIVCAAAGAAVGLILNGPFAAIAGIFLGLIGSHFLAKAIQRAQMRNS